MEDGPGLAAFFRREDWPQLARRSAASDQQPSSTELDRVYEHLRQRGASFVVDISQATGILPARVRTFLGQLVRNSLVTNDRFDALRQLGDPEGPPPKPGLAGLRRNRLHRMDGRWSLLTWNAPETESRALYQAYLLLERYGVVTREQALLDPWLLPWRVLYEVYSRLELAGEVRRGYFVEGLSGAQFALPEAVSELAQIAALGRAAAPIVLVHSQDPANLYGANSPLGWPTAVEQPENATTFARRPGNWLALRGGHPILAVENHGKRLIPLPAASADDLAAAVAALADLLRTARGAKIRSKVSVEEWGGEPIQASPGRDYLEAAGFVRDYPAMTLYGAWQ
jgi:ATP-dependent Lhr-like helicase